MKFELKLDMYNAEQEAVWLNNFIREHDVDDLETEVKRSEPEVGTMDGGSWLPILEGVTAGVATEAIKWLIGKVYQHFNGKKGSLEFTANCPKNGKSFTMTLETGNEKKRDEAQAEFDRRYEEMCGKDEKKGKKKKK
jgi:hypothetical protein